MATAATTERRARRAVRTGRSPLASSLPALALTAIPGALVVYFSFNSGGFFAGAVGFAALVLIQVLIAHVLLAARPFGGYGRAFVAVGLALTAYVGWVLLSGTWAHALNRTLVEFDRDFTYLLAFAAMGCTPRRSHTVSWVVRWLALGMLVVCVSALLTRTLPHVWPTSPGVANNRLSFPLTYWNALGILAACGALLALGLTTSLREPPAVRAAAAAALPVFATTLLFTFSRGAIGAAIVGVVALVALSRSPGLVGGLIGALPLTGVALAVAYQADQLATLDPTAPRGIAQGKTVALAVLLCALGSAALRLLARPIDRRLERFTLSGRARRSWRWAAAAAAVVAIAVAVAAGAPSKLADEYHRFASGSAPAAGTRDLRARLTDPGSNGRTSYWHVAAAALADAPFHGYGAGTYEEQWEKRRKGPLAVVDAHSLYLEVGAELGVVGLLLLVGVIVAVLVTLLRRASGPNRALYVALFAATLAWAIHAGIDWDWEMPAVTAWVFAVGGLALARRRGAGDGTTIGSRWRVPIAVALLLTAVTPVLLLFSQSRLGAAAAAFERGDCRAAQARAIGSIDALAVRPEPYQILGYCDIERRQPAAAIAAMRKAVSAEPASWEYHYGLALAQAAAGVDPLPELKRSLRADPFEPLTRKAYAALRKRPRRAWPAVARRLVASTVSSGRLTLR